MFLSSWSSPECSPACHAGDRGFKSHRGRFLRKASPGAVRNSAKRRSSNLRHSAGSIPACATHWVVLLAAVCKAVVAKQARRATRGSIPSRPTRFGLFVYRLRTPASQAGKAGSIPARVARNTCSIQIHGQVVEPGYARRSERRAVTGMGVRLFPWSLGAGLTQFTLTQADQCPAGPHKPSSSGATPEPATCLQPSTQILAKRSGREPDDFASSTLASATSVTSWSNGDDA